MKQYDPNHEYPDNFTTEMHSELLEDEFTMFEMKILGVKGMMNRGFTMADALEKYGITEKEYNDNCDAVFKKL